MVSFTARELDEHRRPLRAFCYQLLGSPFDAEDAVQDAMERAWRARESFDPAIASLSTWVFRIARNICFDRLRELPRRPLPRDLSDPGIDVAAPLVPALDVPWLMPAPTAWWNDSAPEQATERAEGVRLAVTAVLQTLSPRLRGVFILRDVLGYSAAEAAEILEMSRAAVNSALPRARAAIRERAPRSTAVRPETVERYARAIERADVSALAALVTADVLFEMPPVPQWSIGRPTYAAFMEQLFVRRGTRWATEAVSANGQPGILLFLVTDSGRVPHTVQLFELDAGGSEIRHVLVYQNPDLFSLFEKSASVDDDFGGRET